jgi:uncharacterized membrane protein
MQQVNENEIVTLSFDFGAEDPFWSVKVEKACQMLFRTKSSNTAIFDPKAKTTLINPFLLTTN